MSLQQLSWPRGSSRLELRPARGEDCAEVWNWQRLEEVTTWMPRRYPTIEAFTSHFTKTIDQTLVGISDGSLVAAAKVAVQDAWAQDEIAERARGTEAEIGWALDPAVHGQGLGTELAQELLSICFDGLGLHRVVAVCFAENHASVRVMEKVGMRREAHFRSDSLHRDGGWRDSYLYAILAQEWATR